VQNLKTNVLTALQTASALSTLTFYYFYPPDFTSLPCGSYFELDNTGSLYADDQEIGSEIVFQIDLWGKTSLSTYALAVDTAMTGIDFVRISAPDLYENETKIFHKSMRYRRNYSDPSF
jgi:hypothetical protein